jgi:hypothetical protein
MRPILLASIIAVLFMSCKKEQEIDTTPPPPPQGIRTISLDNAIEVRWLASQASDVDGYNIWVSSSYDGKYQLIATTASTSFVDYGAVNGTTYYYALSAYDFDDNESALSKDVVYDTPRPEGYGVVVFDTTTSINYSGYGFAKYKVLNCHDIYTDFFVVRLNGYIYLDVFSDTDIQDMGYTSSLDEISASPIDGWAPSKSAEAIVGHTYVVWTVDDNYAKIRVREVGADRIKFDWAYQTTKSNIELKVAKHSRNARKLRK